MFTCYRYYLIEPLQKSYADSGLPPLVAFEVNGSKRRYEIAVLASDTGAPGLLRIAIFGLPSEEIPVGAVPTLQTLKEHALSVLKLVDDPHTKLFPTWCYWIFVPDGKPPSFNIEMSTFMAAMTFNGEEFRNLFNSSFKARVMLKLLTEALTMTIPLNYQYLSLYRVLELVYKDGGHWTPIFDTLMEEYGPKFWTLGISPKSLKAYVETTRNRCAHGRFRNAKTDEPGMMTLDNEALAELKKFLPFMTELAISAINRHPDSTGFSLSTIPFSAEDTGLDLPPE